MFFNNPGSNINTHIIARTSRVKKATIDRPELPHSWAKVNSYYETATSVDRAEFNDWLSTKSVHSVGWSFWASIPIAMSKEL